MRRAPILATAVVLSLAAALAGPATTARAVDADQSEVVSGTPVTWNPSVLDGQVNAIAAVGPDIVIGGTFTQVKDSAANGGATYDQPYLAAFDAATGKVDPSFAPTFGGITGDDVTAGHAVDALATNGSNVIVGGVFNAVDGFTQHGITELNLSGGRVTSFVADLNGTNKQVGALVVAGGKVYVGGKFEMVSSAKRSSLAVLSAATGAVQPLDLAVTGTRYTGTTTSVTALDVSPDGSTLVIGGNFTKVAGVLREQLATINLVTGKLTTWQTTRFSPVCPTGWSDIRQLDISPDGRYFVVAAGDGAAPGEPDLLCDAASRWEIGPLGPGQNPTWVDHTGGDTLTSVAVTGTAVYVGGHQRWVNNYGGVNVNMPGAVDRKMVAALDPATGLPLSWNPGKSRGGQGIFDMLATPTGLWLGSDETASFGASYPQRLQFFPLAGGTTVPTSAPLTLPNNLFSTNAANGLDRRSYNGTVFGVPSAVPTPGGVSWGSVNGAFMLGGSVYYGTTDGVLHKAPFNGSTVGASSAVSTFWSTSGITSFTYGGGRMYYVTGDGALYYRWFSPESDVVGTEQVTAAASGYTGVSEMFVAAGSLYYAKTDHRLYRVTLSALTGAPSGVATAVSGPGIDGTSWSAKAAFLSSFAIRPSTRVYTPGQPGTWAPGVPTGRHRTSGLGAAAVHAAPVATAADSSTSSGTRAVVTSPGATVPVTATVRSAVREVASELSAVLRFGIL